MSLRTTLVGANIVETMQNYTRADDPLLQTGFAIVNTGVTKPTSAVTLYDDDVFWQYVLQDKTILRYWFEFHEVTVSEWVARVPGLAWSKEAIRLRNNVEHLERMIGGYAYTPPVKSEFVMSGIGSLRLSPGADGSALITLSAFGDASLGIPALMSADVFDKIQQDGSVEGRIISGQARWVGMSETWAANFPIVNKLPRGYLLLDKPEDITVSAGLKPTQIFPFTVMEYESGASELFDYVYVAASTGDKQYRQRVDAFFEKYKGDIGGRAEYLFNADMIDPLWPATYQSPADLRRSNPGAPSQLFLLEARVRERQIGKTDIELLLKSMGETVTDEDAKVISDEIGIPFANWYISGLKTADMCSAFVAAAIQHDRVPALLQALAIHKPGFFFE
jgi:hypothetical protein